MDGKDGAQMVIGRNKGYELGLPKDKFIKRDLKTFGSQKRLKFLKNGLLTQGK